MLIINDIIAFIIEIASLVLYGKFSMANQIS